MTAATLTLRERWAIHQLKVARHRAEVARLNLMVADFSCIAAASRLRLVRQSREIARMESDLTALTDRLDSLTH